MLLSNRYKDFCQFGVKCCLSVYTGAKFLLWGTAPKKEGLKMITYKNYTIEKVSKRGLYVVINNLNQPIAVLTLLRDCKKFVDRKVGA